jgi:hypothetical protein
MDFTAEAQRSEFVLTKKPLLRVLRASAVKDPNSSTVGGAGEAREVTDED